MQKFNFMVEVEVNDQWVHAHVETLAEARALIDALNAVDAEKACIFDNEIFLTEDATNEARADYEKFQIECMEKCDAWLEQMLAEKKMTLENGVYKGRLVDLA